jgi:hypothetical protein
MNSTVPGRTTDGERLIASAREELEFKAKVDEVQREISDPHHTEPLRAAFRERLDELYRQRGYSTTSSGPKGQSPAQMSAAARAENARIFTRLSQEKDMPKAERDQLLARQLELHTRRAES